MNEIVTLTDTQTTALAVRTDVDTDSALDLLQYVAGWDNRKASRAQAEAWALSAQMAGWTLAEAKDAVRWLLTHDTAYLTPAAVTARIESQRRRARLSEEGTNPDGTRKVTFTAALEVWRDAFRSVGPNPSAEQEMKASELLEQMLDGAGDPVTVLDAAVIAGRKMSPRVDWTLEKIAADDQHRHRMPLCPVEYIRDGQLDVAWAVKQPDFPREWRLYDPLPPDIPKLSREYYIPEWLSFNNTGRVPDFERPQRDLPEWLVEHVTDGRYRDMRTSQLRTNSLSDEERAAEAEEYRERQRQVLRWLKDDRDAWDQERVAVVRAWYAEHPHRRRAFEQPSIGSSGWWEN